MYSFLLAAATKDLEQLKADDLTGINDEEHGKTKHALSRFYFV